MYSFNWLCNPPLVIKLHTHAPNESSIHTCVLLILGSKSQMSRSCDWWLKWFPNHTCTWLYRNSPLVMKLPTLAPHESRMCPFDFWVKSQRSRSCHIDDWSGFWIIADLSNSSLVMELPTLASNESKMCVPYWFWGQMLRSNGDLK